MCATEPYPIQIPKIQDRPHHIHDLNNLLFHSVLTLNLINYKVFCDLASTFFKGPLEICIKSNVEMHIFIEELSCWLGHKESTCNARDQGLIPGSGRPLEKKMATHSTFLAWSISWTEEPGGLQTIVLQRVGHN